MDDSMRDPAAAGREPILAGSESWRLMEALVSGFDAGELARLVNQRLNAKAEPVIVPADSALQTAFDVVRWAIATGRVGDLVAVAVGEEPDNVLLREFARGVWHARATALPDPASIAADADVVDRGVEYSVNRSILRVLYSDITQVAAQAVVSSDDTDLSMGGGVSRALRRAAGETVRREAAALTPLRAGDVAVTSAGNLAAKYIFHAAIVDYRTSQHPNEEIVRAATLKCLELADRHRVRHIAFPALGTGVAGLDEKVAADVMMQSIADYLRGPTQIEIVTIVLFYRHSPRYRHAPGSKSSHEREILEHFERAAGLAAITSQRRQLDRELQELEALQDGDQGSAADVAAAVSALERATDRVDQSGALPLEVAPPQMRRDDDAVLEALANVHAAFKGSGRDSQSIRTMLEKQLAVYSVILNHRNDELVDLLLAREALIFAKQSVPAGLTSNIGVLEEEVVRASRRVMLVQLDIQGRDSPFSTGQHGSDPLPPEGSLALDRQGDSGSETWRTRLPQLILQLPAVDTPNGRNLLLAGIPNAYFNRDAGNKGIDVSLIVDQVIALGELKDGGQPVAVLIKNALDFAVEGSAVRRALQELLETIERG